MAGLRVRYRSDDRLSDVPGAPVPPVSDSPDLRVVTASPFNAETLLDEQVGVITPVERHYVRSHFAVPMHEGFVRIEGSVARTLAVSVEDLQRRASTSMVVTLECAGNGRGSLVPPAPGEQWGIGAVGTAEWTGVPLADLLAEADPLPETVELVFSGADEGLVGAVGRVMEFERSMPLADAGAALVAVGVNGRPLTPAHGAPVRLLVPGSYGMASVKWLSRITAVTEPFRGFFQADRYVVDGRPLGPIAPRAVIATPAEGSALAAGPVVIRGYAWSGHGLIDRVDLSTDAGGSWSSAVLGPTGSATAWREWELPWTPPRTGAFTLLARATDGTGTVQPLDQVRTDLGYGNNAARPVVIQVE